MPERIFDVSPRPAALLVDIEGTLTPFSPSWTQVLDAMQRYDALAVASGFDLSLVHYVTNSNLRRHNVGIERMHVSARKPFFSPPTGIAALGRTAAVIGDQYLTDGLLAWRFGFTFGLVTHAPGRPRATWPCLQLIIGRAVLWPLFGREY